MQSKSRQELDDFVDKEIIPYYEDLTKSRNEMATKLKAQMKKYGPLTIVSFVLSHILKDYPLIAFLCLGTSAYCFFNMFKGAGKQYSQIMHKEQFEFKNEVIGKLVRFLDSGFSYKISAKFPEHLFYGCGLFQNRADLNSISDIIEGQMGKSRFLFSEVHTQNKKTRKDSKGRKTTYYETVFRGIFFVANFPKKFSGHTIIKTDLSEKKIGFIGRGIQRFVEGDQLVELEDPEFEEYFKVTSTDQIEARYILSSSFMNRLKELRESFDSKIELSFIKSKVIVTIPMARNMFEYQRSDSKDQYKEQIQHFIRDFEMISYLVDELQLNSQIWSYDSSYQKGRSAS